MGWVGAREGQIICLNHNFSTSYNFTCDMKTVLHVQVEDNVVAVCDGLFQRVLGLLQVCICKGHISRNMDCNQQCPVYASK